MQSAVLLLIFNRPETTYRVFDAIRAARPTRLYIAADGARANRPGEAERCHETRSIVESIDWPCQIRTLFRDTNLGCKNGVSSAISWFFTHETEGIILEDDVLPVPTFFDYCDELLARYRNDNRVFAVSGSNLVGRRVRTEKSYFFSRYNCIWGWATWRRAWSHYDVAMKDWPPWRDANGLSTVSGGSRLFESYWRDLYDKVHAGQIDTWDYQWSFASWRLGGLTALPAVNQTFNLGFGADATHTTADTPNFVLESRPELLPFPLEHPSDVTRNEVADLVIDSYVLGISGKNVLRRRLMAIPVLRTVATRLKSAARTVIK